MTDATRTIGLLLVFLLGLIVMSAWRSTEPLTAPRLDDSIRKGVDPNIAPWWELTALPGVGESTARSIIAYRDAQLGSGLVFRKPLDLEPVPNVGQKTIQRIASHLRFDVWTNE